MTSLSENQVMPPVMPIKINNNFPPDLETLRIQALEYLKIRERIKRHGQNIVLKRGRKPHTDEQKKERRRLYEEKKRQIKKDNGTYVPRGRPRKNSHISK
jgi:hypothetical protein